jgi:metal-responsive CopG/Arc/MetJ family transcriptional regulator
MKINQPNKKTVLIGVRIESKLFERINELAEKNSVSNPEVIRQCLTKLLIKKKVPAEKRKVLD